MPSNHSAWVVATDSNTCRIYQYSKKPSQLTLLKELTHPENKLKNIDLTTDRPGRFKSNNVNHGAYQQPTDPKEIKIEDFSREIAKELDQGRNNHSYNNLIIIAPPHMNGLLLNHINKHVKELIAHKIEKNVIPLPDHELLNFLQTHTQFPGDNPLK